MPRPKSAAPRPRPRGGLLRDGLLLLAHLTRGHSTVEELTESTGLHRRTVYRVLGAWRATGLRVETVREGGQLVWHHVPERELLRCLARLRTRR